MRTVTYHVAYSATVFAAGMGQLNIVRPGRIVGYRINWSGIAGAGGTFGGNASLMLNQNAINDTLTNNPPRETFLGSVSASSAAGSTFGSSGCAGFCPLAVPVIQGDMLSLNGGNSGGAAPASSFLWCDVYIVETGS
jgi:hypothetical protein